MAPGATTSQEFSRVSQERTKEHQEEYQIEANLMLAKCVHKSENMLQYQRIGANIEKTMMFEKHSTGDSRIASSGAFKHIF